MMSWFDTVGLANLAKNALKEAQKTIDKALDIKDDNGFSSSPPSSENLSSPHQPPITESLSSLNNEIGKPINMKHSISNPTISTQNNSIWGSFSGSFFDNPNTDGQPVQTVTIPPSSSSTSLAKVSALPSSQVITTALITEKIINSPETELMDEQPSIRRRDKSENKQRLSIVSDNGQNSSESVEILSTPTTPSSNLTSPGAVGAGTESSVEVIGVDTPSSELISPLSASIEPTSISTTITELSETKISSPDSVHIITDEICEEDISIEDDSISYSTVTESMAIITVKEASTTGKLT